MAQTKGRTVRERERERERERYADKVKGDEKETKRKKGN